MRATLNTTTTLSGGKPLHHATVKRADRLGVTITNAADGGFRLIRKEDGMLSIDSYDSTAEALEELEDDRCEFETEEEAEEASGTAKCGVMAKSYHDEYSKNPNGPGCGDTVDTEMRDAIMVLFEGEKTPRVDVTVLRQIGEDAGLWKTTWESLNVGMQRMNLANRIRGFLRNNAEGKVTIGDTEGRFGVEAKEPKVKKGKAPKVAAPIEPAPAPKAKRAKKAPAQASA